MCTKDNHVVDHVHRPVLDDDWKSHLLAKDKDDTIQLHHLHQTKLSSVAIVLVNCNNTRARTSLFF